MNLLLFLRKDIRIHEDSQVNFKNKILTGWEKAGGWHTNLKTFFQLHHKRGRTRLNLSFSKLCFHCYTLLLSLKSFDILKRGLFPTQ